MSDDLLAHVFNPDVKIAERASRQVAFLDKEALHSVIARVDAERRPHLKEYCEKLDGIEDQFKEDNFEVLLLSPLAGKISLSKLFLISRYFTRNELRQNEEINAEFLNGGNYFLYFSSGKINLKNKDLKISLTGGEFYRTKEMNINKDEFLKVSTEENVSLLALKEDDLKELIFDDEEEFLPLLDVFIVNHD